MDMARVFVCPKALAEQAEEALNFIHFSWLAAKRKSSGITTKSENINKKKNNKNARVTKKKNGSILRQKISISIFAEKKCTL